MMMADVDMAALQKELTVVWALLCRNRGVEIATQNPIMGVACAVKVLKRHGIEYEVTVGYIGHPIFGDQPVLLPYCWVDTPHGMIDVTPLIQGDGQLSKVCVSMGKKMSMSSDTSSAVAALYRVVPGSIPVIEAGLTTKQLFEVSGDPEAWVRGSGFTALCTILDRV